MSRKPAPQRSTPTLEQLRRVLYAMAHEARPEPPGLAAERRRMLEERARREAQHRQEALQLARKFSRAKEEPERERAESERPRVERQKEEAKRDPKLEGEL